MAVVITTKFSVVFIKFLLGDDILLLKGLKQFQVDIFSTFP